MFHWKPRSYWHFSVLNSRGYFPEDLVPRRMVPSPLVPRWGGSECSVSGRRGGMARLCIGFAVFVMSAAAFISVAWAAANRACVTCEAPLATYSCTVGPAADGTRVSLAVRPLHFACIKDIARRFQHGSCRVKRNPTGDCLGRVHMIDPEKLRSRDAVVPAAQPDNGTGEGHAAKAGKSAANNAQDNREPRTVVEMAEETAKTTEKEMKRSAENVSQVAKSTWRCLTSLFSDC